jgi:DNA-binding NarL/FixJ family response regulator
MRFARPSPRRAAVRSTWNGFANFPNAVTRLNKGGIDAVLLELSLPDSHGIETFDKLFIAAPDVPILILGGNANETLAKQALGRAGLSPAASPR